MCVAFRYVDATVVAPNKLAIQDAAMLRMMRNDAYIARRAAMACSLAHASVHGATRAHQNAMLSAALIPLARTGRVMSVCWRVGTTLPLEALLHALVLGCTDWIQAAPTTLSRTVGHLGCPALSSARCWVSTGELILYTLK